MELREGYKHTEVGVIPNEWEVNPLFEIGEIATGFTPPTINKNNYGEDYFFVSPADLGKGKYIVDTEKKLSKLGFSISRKFPAFSILFTCIGSTIGKAGIAKIELTSNQQINAVFPNESYSTDFLFYYLNFISPKIKLGASEQAVPMINKTEFGKTFIAFPPKTEQTAIATAISDADALINSLEKLIAKKRNIKQGAIQHLLQPKEGWEVKKLGEIAEVRDGTHQTPTYVESGIPFYSVESVTNNDFKNTKYITEEAHKLLTKTFKIEKGDILMTRIGSIGDCKLVDWDVNASFYVSLALLKIKSGYSAKYVYHFSKTAYFKKEADISSLQSAIPKKINLGPISNIKIQMPDYDEQMRIATILSVMDTEIQALETKLDKYRKIKLGMMQNLLTGKIRLI